MTGYVALGSSFASGPGIELIDVTCGAATIDNDGVRFCAGIGRRLAAATAEAAMRAVADAVVAAVTG